MELVKTSRSILMLGVISLCIFLSKTEYCPQEKVGSFNCTQACPVLCKDKLCHASNGNCLACNPGYIGPSCTQECPSKTYGDRCSLTCSINCLDNICHNVNGNCIKGCVIGFEGAQCTLACKQSTYGQNCSQNCSPACKARECHAVSGNCTQGCLNGYVGVKCEQICSSGKFGAECSQTCPANCYNEVCKPDTGHCDSCRSGYQGLRCEEPCPTNMFGQNCSNSCSQNCQQMEPNETTCHHVTGACLLGCQDDYAGHQCLNKLDTSRFILNTALLINLILGFIIILGLLAILARYYKIHQRRFLRKENTPSDNYIYSAPSFSRQSDPPYAPFLVAQGDGANKEGDRGASEEAEAADQDLIYENTTAGQEAGSPKREEVVPEVNKQTSAVDEKVYANFRSIKDRQ